MTNAFRIDKDQKAIVFGDELFGIIVSNDGITFIKDGKERTLEEVFSEACNLEYAPVIKAEWIKIGTGITERWGCSNCKRMPLDHDTFYKPAFHYCPRCGAKMMNPRKID